MKGILPFFLWYLPPSRWLLISPRLSFFLYFIAFCYLFDHHYIPLSEPQMTERPSRAVSMNGLFHHPPLEISYLHRALPDLMWPVAVTAKKLGHLSRNQLLSRTRHLDPACSHLAVWPECVGASLHLTVSFSFFINKTLPNPPADHLTLSVQSTIVTICHLVVCFKQQTTNLFASYFPYLLFFFSFSFLHLLIIWYFRIAGRFSIPAKPNPMSVAKSHEFVNDLKWVSSEFLPLIRLQAHNIQSKWYRTMFVFRNCGP